VAFKECGLGRSDIAEVPPGRNDDRPIRNNRQYYITLSNEN